MGKEKGMPFSLPMGKEKGMPFFLCIISHFIAGIKLFFSLYIKNTVIV